VRERPAWSGYLALGTQVTFVAEDGTAYQVQAGDDVIENPLPQGPSAPSASAPLPAPETTPTPLPAAIARQAQEQQLCGGAIVLMLLVLGAALLLRH